MILRPPARRPALALGALLLAAGCAPVTGGPPAATQAAAPPPAVDEAPAAPPPSADPAAAPFVAPWLLGTWVDSTIERTGPDTIRMSYSSGNRYDYRVVVVGDVVELHGTFEGTPSLIKLRRIDDETFEYFYHYFEGREHPAKNTFWKLAPPEPAPGAPAR